MPAALSSALAIATVLPASAQVSLQLIPAGPASPPVQSVVDAVAVRSGLPINPFRYDCVAFLEVVENGAALRLDGPGWSTAGVTVRPVGHERRAVHPEVVRVTGLASNRLVVLLEPASAETEYVVRVDEGQVVDASGTPRTLHDLRSEPFRIPREALEACGRVPSFEVEILEPTRENRGVGVSLDVVRRRPLGQGRGGLWELFARGSAASGDSAVLMDSWIAGGRADIKLTTGWEHWISLGGSARFEGTESSDVIDRVLSADLRVRLDFLGIDEILRPFLARFTPYPMLVVGYDNVDRVSLDVEAGALPAESEHRLRAGVDWEVPLVFDTTLRVDWEAFYLFSDVAPDEDRFRSLSNVTLEYPLTSTGELAAVLTLMNGEAPPIFRSVSELLIGFGIRR